MTSRRMLLVMLICLVPCLAAAQNPLVYVSFLTGAKAGGTNVYQITQSGAQLMDTLDRGGGGPVAVDKQQNVYVVQADLGNGGYQQDSAVYMYAPGGTKGALLFTAKSFGIESMTVAADGTFYAGGQVPGTGNTFAVVKFAPPSYSPQILGSGENPRYPVGISLDASGNLFVGWLISDSNYPVGPCNSGCITELPAGQSTWQVRLPDLAANAIVAGPFATTDGSLVFWSGNDGRFDYLETVASGRNYPSQVQQLSPMLFNASNAIIAFNAGGTQLWATGSGLGAGRGTNVVGINYPSGSVALSFKVTSPANLLWISGIGVSPAYFP